VELRPDHYLEIMTKGFDPRIAEYNHSYQIENLYSVVRKKGEVVGL
jgi:hypothetical protein